MRHPMFVHSLVKVTEKNRHGWRAPVELGDAVPHYISYVLPVGGDNALMDEYTCEIATITTQGRNHDVRKLVKAGTDSFALELTRKIKLWFHVRGVGKSERRLPYVGHVQHADFEYLLTEIVPHDNSELDRLCEQQGIFIIGCDPERHYSGIASLRKLG